MQIIFFVPIARELRIFNTKLTGETAKPTKLIPKSLINLRRFEPLFKVISI